MGRKYTNFEELFLKKWSIAELFQNYQLFQICLDPSSGSYSRPTEVGSLAL